MKSCYVIFIGILEFTLLFSSAWADEAEKNHERVSPLQMGLKWLADHQEPGGRWDSDKYGGEENADILVTSSALSAFLSAGYTERIGRYKNTVRNGIRWLVKQQNADGSFTEKGLPGYTHGLCMSTLACSFGMGGDRKYKWNVERAVEYSISIMNEFGFWSALRKKGDSDILTTAFHLLGLKEALIAGGRPKEIKQVFERCKFFLDGCVLTTGDNFTGTYGWAWSKIDPQTGKVLYIQKDGSRAQVCAGLCRIFMGWRCREPWLKKVVNDQVSRGPAWKERDLMHIFLAHVTIIFSYGKMWSKWDKDVRLGLIPDDQNTENGDNKGSWDPGKGPESIGGRVMSTALACLMLETYCRRSPVFVID